MVLSCHRRMYLPYFIISTALNGVLFLKAHDQISSSRSFHKHSLPLSFNVNSSFRLQSFFLPVVLFLLWLLGDHMRSCDVESKLRPLVIGCQTSINEVRHKTMKILRQAQIALKADTRLSPQTNKLVYATAVNNKLCVITHPFLYRTCSCLSKDNFV